jgi:hypothetical protein
MMLFEFSWQHFRIREFSIRDSGFVILSMAGGKARLVFKTKTGDMMGKSCILRQQKSPSRFGRLAYLFDVLDGDLLKSVELSASQKNKNQ